MPRHTYPRLVWIVLPILVIAMLCMLFMTQSFMYKNRAMPYCQNAEAYASRGISYKDARRWFERLLELARAAHPGVETGRFGAHMVIHLVNDGPVTFRLDTG